MQDETDPIIVVGNDAISNDATLGGINTLSKMTSLKVQQSVKYPGLYFRTISAF